MPSKGSGRLPLGALAVGAVGLAFLACLGTFWFLRDRREFAEVKRLLLEIERQPAEAKGAEIERARSLYPDIASWDFMSRSKLTGLHHLVPLSKASASLALLSTLIMNQTFTHLLQRSNDTATLLMAIGNAFSSYTVTYSILEFYYVQYMNHTAEMHTPSQDILHLKVAPVESYDQFVRDVTQSFARFNRMRRLSRNAMWMSMYCLVSAARTSTVDNKPFLAEYHLTSSMKAAAVFLWMTIITSLVWLFDFVHAFPTAHFDRLTALFGSCAIVCSAIALVAKDEIPMLNVMAFFVMFINICSVAACVAFFRLEFQGMARSHGIVV